MPDKTEITTILDDSFEHILESNGLQHTNPAAVGFKREENFVEKDIELPGGMEQSLKVGIIVDQGAYLEVKAADYSDVNDETRGALLWYVHSAVSKTLRGEGETLKDSEGGMVIRYDNAIISYNKHLGEYKVKYLLDSVDSDDIEGMLDEINIDGAEFKNWFVETKDNVLRNLDEYLKENESLVQLCDAIFKNIDANGLQDILLNIESDNMFGEFMTEINERSSLSLRLQLENNHFIYDIFNKLSKLETSSAVINIFGKDVSISDLLNTTFWQGEFDNFVRAIINGLFVHRSADDRATLYGEFSHDHSHIPVDFNITRILPSSQAVSMYGVLKSKADQIYSGNSVWDTKPVHGDFDVRKLINRIIFYPNDSGDEGDYSQYMNIVDATKLLFLRNLYFKISMLAGEITLEKATDALASYYGLVEAVIIGSESIASAEVNK